MSHAGPLIDAVQTAGIIVIAAALIYVVMRLEKEIRNWTSSLAEVNRQLRGQPNPHHDQQAVLDSLNKIWNRINAIEKHVGIRRDDP